MQAATHSIDITEGQFEEISQLVRSKCGINLHQGKRELVRARLSKRLRALNMETFDSYLDYLRQADDKGELVAMLDAISTNLTSFFREPDHLDYLSESIVRRMPSPGALRIWSAGCSSGEEPYSIAMQLAESVSNLPQWDVRILATDLSTRVLQRARLARYGADRVRGLPESIVKRYFTVVREQGEPQYQVVSSLQDLISFGRLNLMDAWPMRGPFDVVFCRNVMIYFDKRTQGELIARFWQILRPGGTLFIGHSESLTGIVHRFCYVQPSIYRKP